MHKLNHNGGIVDRSAAPAASRRGAILVLAAMVMIMVLAFAAFTIDIGYITLTKTQMQTAVDSAALAAALELDPTIDQDDVETKAKAAAVLMASKHLAGDQSNFVIDPDRDVKLGKRIFDHSTGEFTYEWGPNAKPYNVVKVYGSRVENVEEDEVGNQVVKDNRLPLFFAPVLGHDKAEVKVDATAGHQPRDICLVLDYSASMNDDTQYDHISLLGQAETESAMRKMWESLGSPTYGNMTNFIPEYLTAQGVPQSNWQQIPHIEVTWRGREVDIVSTHHIAKVRLEFDGGGSQTFSYWGNDGTRTCKGTYSPYSYRNVEKVWVESWGNEDLDPTGYDRGEYFSFTKWGMKEHLGLNDVDYPGNSGSWDRFIDHCIDSSGSTSNYSYGVFAAGYRRKFGLMTLMNFYNEEYPLHSQTPFLWQADQQPVTAVKNASKLLADLLIEHGSEDKLGLVAYTDPNNNGARVEMSLTDDYAAVKDIITKRQAGHYDYMTNIAAGMRDARLELTSNARPKAHRLMVLMTDGLANRTPYNNMNAADSVRYEAEQARDSGIQIITISVGVGADSGLMEEVAEITGGSHLNVPGGTTIAAMEDSLNAAFRFVAGDHPLKLMDSPD